MTRDIQDQMHNYQQMVYLYLNIFLSMKLLDVVSPIAKILLIKT